jgi:hypothetical protein
MMRLSLQLAAVFPLLAASACAQISNPDALVAPAPRNPAMHSGHRNGAEDLQWLWQYANHDKQALLDEPRFQELLAEDLRAPQSMWGVGEPLAEAARTFLGGEGAVTSTDNRHIIVTGCVVEHCPQRGMLWLDLGSAEPLTVFAALRWTERGRSTDEPHAPFNLWIFPSRELAADRIPAALKTSLSTWVNTRHCAATVSTVLLVEPNGIPHILGALDAGVQPTCAPSTTGIPQ